MSPFLAATSEPEQLIGLPEGLTSRPGYSGGIGVREGGISQGGSADIVHVEYTSRRNGGAASRHGAANRRKVDGMC